MSHYLLAMLAGAGIVGGALYANSMTDSGSTSDLGLPALRPSLESQVGKRSANLQFPAFDSKMFDGAFNMSKQAPARSRSSATGGVVDSFSSAYNYVSDSLADAQQSLDDTIASFANAGKQRPGALSNRRSSARRR